MHIKWEREINYIQIVCSNDEFMPKNALNSIQIHNFHANSIAEKQLNATTVTVDFYYYDYVKFWKMKYEICI